MRECSMNVKAVVTQVESVLTAVKEGVQALGLTEAHLNNFFEKGFSHLDFKNVAF